MKNNPKYVRSPEKSYPVRPILCEFDTLQCIHGRTYSAQLWKKSLLREFSDEPDTLLDIQVAPLPPDLMIQVLWLSQHGQQLFKLKSKNTCILTSGQWTLEVLKVF